MSSTHRSDAPLIPGYHHSGDRGLGVRGDAVPRTGTHGGALLAQGINLPAEAADEFRIEILTVPAGLTDLFVDEDSSATASAPPNGVYQGTYRAYKNGVPYGESTYTITWGDGLTGTITLDDILVEGTIEGAPTVRVPLGRAVGPRVGLRANGEIIILI